MSIIAVMNVLDLWRCVQETKHEMTSGGCGPKSTKIGMSECLWIQLERKRATCPYPISGIPIRVVKNAWLLLHPHKKLSVLRISSMIQFCLFYPKRKEKKQSKWGQLGFRRSSKISKCVRIIAWKTSAPTLLCLQVSIQMRIEIIVDEIVPCGWNVSFFMSWFRLPKAQIHTLSVKGTACLYCFFPQTKSDIEFMKSNIRTETSWSRVHLFLQIVGGEHGGNCGTWIHLRSRFTARFALGFLPMLYIIWGLRLNQRHSLRPMFP